VSNDGTRFRINNEGSEGDEYTVEVNGKIAGSAIVISAGKNKEVFVLASDMQRGDKSGTTVKVWSAKNKNLVREISFDD
jgi:hypothetical protein